jgi:hypothetical protein
MGQRYESLVKNCFLQKWILIVAFDGISLVLNVFIEILIKNHLEEFLTITPNILAHSGNINWYKNFHCLILSHYGSKHVML